MSRLVDLENSLDDSQKKDLSEKLELLMSAFGNRARHNPARAEFYDGVVDALNNAYKLVNGEDDDYNLADFYDPDDDVDIAASSENYTDAPLRFAPEQESSYLFSFNNSLDRAQRAEIVEKIGRVAMIPAIALTESQSGRERDYFLGKTRGYDFACDMINGVEGEYALDEREHMKESGKQRKDDSGLRIV